MPYPPQGPSPRVEITAASEAYPKGWHEGNPGGLSAIETDLAPANIKKDENIFGKVGTVVEMDVSDADATEDDVNSGKTFYSVAAPRKTGTAVIIPKATLANFRQYAATSPNFYNPFEINNGLWGVGDRTRDGVTGRYCEVNFGKLVSIDQWRQHGDTSNDGDGFWKIQYMNSAGSWVDWVTGIPTMATSSWSTMQSGPEVTTRYIRWVITTVDGAGMNWIREVEVYHS